MVQIRYYRADKQRIDHVNYLLPDTQSLALDDAQWMLAETKIAEQLKAKLANVDALKIEEDEPPVVMMVEESESVVAAAAAAADVVPEQSIPDVKKEEELQAEEPKVLDNVKESIVLLWVSHFNFAIFFPKIYCALFLFVCVRACVLFVFLSQAFTPN